jgi:hypothetical protein
MYGEKVKIQAAIFSCTLYSDPPVGKKSNSKNDEYDLEKLSPDKIVVIRVITRNKKRNPNK